MVSKMENKYTYKEKVDFKKNFVKYWAFLKPYKWLFIASSFFVFIVSFVHVFERYLFKELIDKGTLFVNGTITKEAMIGIIILIAIAYISTAGARILSDWLRFHLINKMERKMLIALKTQFFNHILDLSHNFHTSHRTGSLIARFTRGAKALEGITDFLVFETIPLGLEFIIVIVSFIYLDPISAIVLTTMVTIFIMYSVLLLTKQQKALVSFNKTEDVEKAYLSDSFMNIETIKFFAKHDYVKDNFFTISEKATTKLMNVWQYARWMVSGHGIIFVFSLIALLASPLIGLLNGTTTIGTVAFIYTIYVGMAGPLGRFTWHLRSFFNSMADFQSLRLYQLIKNEVKDKEGAKTLKVKEGKIEFENVSFSYNKRKILKNINLEIKPNEKVALVGHSGSGKTTLVKILYRLYDIQEGKIKIDDKNIENLKQESLRNELSIVPQEGILFNDTIENNIKFSKPNATKKEIKKALKAAQFYKFVQSLPEKEKTIVGERGIKLSGGEKQRLSIARALLANKKILVLDEATSALDSKTENSIQKALWRLMKGRTTLIIAHRLSTIMHADKIIVMNKGKIAQKGSHNELIKQKGIYKELWGLQKGGYLQE
jgi:ATP-binding cassette, subfamily B, heavy metal transporter